MDYKNAMIEALQKRVHELEVKNVQLGTWVYELADEDTPKAYKDNVVAEVNNYMIDKLTDFN